MPHPASLVVIAGTAFGMPDRPSARAAVTDGVFVWQADAQVWQAREASVLLDYFARHFIARHGAPLHLIDVSTAPAPLADWLPGTDRFAALKRQVQQAADALQAAHIACNVAAFVWRHGAEDAASAATAAAYAPQLQSLIAGSSAFCNGLPVPFYIVEPQPDPAQPGTHAVRMAGLRTALTKPYSAHTHFIETGDILSPHAAGFITDEACDMLGQRLAERIKV